MQLDRGGVDLLVVLCPSTWFLCGSQRGLANRDGQGSQRTQLSWKSEELCLAETESEAVGRRPNSNVSKAGQDVYLSVSQDGTGELNAVSTAAVRRSCEIR